MLNSGRVQSMGKFMTQKTRGWRVRGKGGHLKELSINVLMSRLPN